MFSSHWASVRARSSTSIVIGPSHLPLNPALIALAAALSLPLWSSLAQAEEPAALGDIVVSASPLNNKANALAAPVTVLSGQKLAAERQSSLGETLAREVGVSSSYFGPNASRPVIRGLDGERLRILSNGMGSNDASGASQDHAVTLEPLLYERVEILRGPAALQYGGGAIGGVVNVLDGRIPTEKNLGLAGAYSTRYGGAERERSQVLRLDSSNARVGLHADVYDRQTADLKIPGYVRSAARRMNAPLAAGEEERRGSLPNSSSHTRGGALGATAFFDKGYLGTSVSEYQSNYGTVAEESVRIGVHQSRQDIVGEWRGDSWFERLRFKHSENDYRHTEYEDNTPGTYFKNRGRETRLDIQHAPIGRLRGSFGISQQRFSFSALGEEAYLPTTRNENQALYLYEEWTLGALKLHGGLRQEYSRVRSESSENPNFGAGESRNFKPFSQAVGANWQVIPGYILTSNYAISQRAPNYQELFANGPHVATNAWEIGNRQLGIERGRAWDLGLRKTQGVVTGSVTVFEQRFDQYIALIGNGNVNLSGPDPLDEFVYQGVRARFRGAELESRWRILNRQPTTLDLEWRADTVKATNTSSGEPLPRIAPSRQMVSVVYRGIPYSSRLDIQKVQGQGQIAPNELPTAGYWLVNAYSSYRTSINGLDWEWFIRFNNLLNQDIRYHSAFLKDQAPLGKRSALIGGTIRF
ncbi:TonB-dependent receptor [Parvibium lacunae]|uniref:TonB-dependent receptor n=1 Tax=Parvibium lacunae TaxID=1888893 RepID=A0A368L503_9BURK|nr:TonB-dependent receptor [Parvibium lacunae]RCS58638.1 TonB-dependent receptor [Parvibium lacunae]